MLPDIHSIRNHGCARVPYNTVSSVCRAASDGQVPTTGDLLGKIPRGSQCMARTTTLHRQQPLSLPALLPLHPGDDIGDRGRQLGGNGALPLLGLPWAVSTTATKTSFQHGACGRGWLMRRLTWTDRQTRQTGCTASCTLQCLALEPRTPLLPPDLSIPLDSVHMCILMYRL